MYIYLSFFCLCIQCAMSFLWYLQCLWMKQKLLTKNLKGKTLYTCILCISLALHYITVQLSWNTYRGAMKWMDKLFRKYIQSNNTIALIILSAFPAAILIPHTPKCNWGFYVHLPFTVDIICQHVWLDFIPSSGIVCGSPDPNQVHTGPHNSWKSRQTEDRLPPVHKQTALLLTVHGSCPGHLVGESLCTALHCTKLPSGRKRSIGEKCWLKV